MAQVLKSASPNAHVAMLIQRYTRELVEENRFVDRVLFYDNGTHPLPFFQLVALIRAGKFDVVFHTHPLFRLALITWFARIPTRVGTGYRWYSFLFNTKVYEHRKDARFHELEYNLHLLDAIGCPADESASQPGIAVIPEALARVKTLLAERGVDQKNKIVIVHPGSGNSARDWSPMQFGLLIRKLRELPGIQVVITGGEKEQSLVSSVKQEAGVGITTIVGELTLQEFAALTSVASLFVANSTGPLHIAAAVGTPVIGLYPQVTPLSAKRWGPYTNKKIIFTPKGKPLDCTECVGNSGKGCACMDSINVEDVYKAVVQSLAIN